MKKWIIYMLLAVFAATTASAQWWKLGMGDKEIVEPEQVAPKQQKMREGVQQRQRTQLSEAQRAEMKANQEVIHRLAEAARTETDPAKKVVLVDQLRAKLIEDAEKMQAEFRKRLEKAEGDVAKMKERLANAEANIDQRVEERLQALLSGEKPERPEGGRPGGASHKKRARAE